MSGVTGAIVFTDLVGFTEFTALSGDDEALRMLSVQEGIVRALLPDRARIVKELGDGMMLFFPDGCDAVTTMLRALDAFEAAADDEMLPLLVRVGGHFGCPSRRGDDLVGHDANVAARIVDVASPGELLVSDALLGQTDDGEISVTELGPVVMKGLVEPVPLFRVEASQVSAPGAAHA
jgi:adenylate cyclase